MRKLRQILLLSICFLLLCSFNTFADEYDDYTVTVPLLQTVHISKNITNETTAVNLNMVQNYGQTGDKITLFNDSWAYYNYAGPLMTFKLGSTENLKSATLWLKAARYSTSYTGGTATTSQFKIVKYSTDDILVGTTGSATETITDATSYYKFYNEMNSISGGLAASEYVKYGNRVNSETYWNSFNLLNAGKITLKDNCYLTIVINPTNREDYYSAQKTENLPYIELVYDNEPKREEAAKAAVEALEPYTVENSINAENIDTVEELLADAKKKIARLKDGTVKDELTQALLSVEEVKNTFFIEYKRESFTSADGAAIEQELEFPLDFTAESDYFIKAEADISDSLGEESAEITVGDTQIKLNAEGVYLNDEKAADIQSGKNTFVLRFYGTDSRNTELFVNGNSVLKKENQSLSNVSEISAQSTDREKITIGKITVETCPPGFGEAAAAALNEFAEAINDDNAALKELSDLYSDVHSETGAMSESIYADMLSTSADALFAPRLIAERENAETKKDYNTLVLIDSMWDEAAASDTKTEEKEKIETLLSEYDSIAPTVKEVKIIKLSETEYKASYVIEDSIIREAAAPKLSWILNGKKTFGSEATVDVSEYVGSSITLTVTPVNNKGIEGEPQTAEAVIVLPAPQPDDDFTEKIVVKRRFSRSNDSSGAMTGNISLDRYYTDSTSGTKNYMFNDAGYFNEGQQFEFDISSLDLTSLKSAKLVLNAALSSSMLSIRGFVNSNEMPENLGTLSGFSVTDETVLGKLNSIFDSQAEVTLSAENSIESTSTLTAPTEVVFDLLKKDSDGNYIISFETGKDLILNVRIPSGDKKGTLILNDDMLPYIILEVDMEHERVANAKNAVNALLPYDKDGAITLQNLKDVEELIKTAKNKVSRISDADLTAELLVTVASVEKRMNEFSITAGRVELEAEDGKNITATLDEEVIFADNDLFVKVDFDIVKALAENEVIKVSLGDEISAEIKSTGIYLQGEQIAPVPDGETELLIRNSTEYFEDYVELYLNGELIGKKEGLVLDAAETVTVTNNTAESVVTKSMVIEVCPKNYGETAYDLVEETAKAADDGKSPTEIMALYNETMAAIEGMGTSSYTELISEKFDELIDEYVTDTIEGYLTGRKYKEFISYISFITNIQNGILREKLLKEYYETEAEFDKLTPEVLYAGISEDSKNILKAVYTVKDTVGNGKLIDGKDAVLFEWILDNSKVVGTNETIDVSSYKGHSIVLSVTPLNNKNVKGEATDSIAYSVKSDSSPGGGGGGGGGSSSGDSGREAVYTQDTAEAAASATAFRDISSNWAKNEITALKEKNIVNGDENGNFNPDNKVTRAEFVAMLDRANIMPAKGTETEFSDVNNTDWFYENVKKAAASGVVTGNNGVFYPNNAITRQEMALILSRITESDGKSDISNVKDYNNISDWAREGVSEVFALSVMKGDPDGNFRPLDSVTRAEAAAVIYRIIQ